MSIFDRFKAPKPKPRQLTHPRDLLIGDMLDFGLMSQANVTDQSFQVTHIWTLDLGGDSHKRIYLQLQNGQYKLRLRVLADDTFELALEVYPETLLSAFNEADIGLILDPESGVNHHLKPRVAITELAAELSGWVGLHYRQEGFELAYRYDQDYRNKALPEQTNAGELACDFAWLVADNRGHAVEFRVFDGGRTEVHLCVYLPLRKITALWPAKQTQD